MPVYFHIKQSRVRAARYFLVAVLLSSLMAMALQFIEGVGLLTGVAFWPAALALPALLWVSQRRFEHQANYLALALTVVLVIIEVELASEDMASLVWLAFTPLLYFYLSNIFLGSLLSLLTALLLLLLMFFYRDVVGLEEVSSSYLLKVLLAYGAVFVIAWLYEQEWISLDSRLQTNSDYDFLTAVRNRRGVCQILHKSLAQALRHKHPLSLLMFSVDEFYQVAERHGANVADRVLIEMSELVSRHIRSGDTLGRWNGATFILVAPETALEGAGLLAEKLRMLIRTYYFEGVGRMTTSIGIAGLGDETLEELLLKAEYAVGLAEQRRDCVQVAERAGS